MDLIRAGRVDYRASLAWQHRLWAARAAGEIPDTLLILEHPPTVTFGARIRRDHLLVTPEDLRRLGIEIYETRRGGDITYHGPGQIVGYLFADLTPRGRDVHRFVRDLESSLIDALDTFGIRSGRLQGLTGVWVDDEKIAAIGVEIRRWVSRHGFALNYATDLFSYSHIVPCGISDRGVTSMDRVIESVPPREQVENEIAFQVKARFDRSTTKS